MKFLQVFDKLQLISPSLCDGQIRLTPNIETAIKTNRSVLSVAYSPGFCLAPFSAEAKVILISENKYFLNGLKKTKEITVYKYFSQGMQISYSSKTEFYKFILQVIIERKKLNLNAYFI